MWISGNRPAQATANSVIASAKRLIEVRHFWFSRNKIAEISVPAWPIPIHQTKLTIAKPQPMGILMPQIPTPLMISQPTARLSTITMVNAMPNPASQPRETRPRQDDGRDFVGDRGVGMARREHRGEPADFGRIERRLADAHAFSRSGLGLRTADRYVVRGRAFSSPRIV